jgi:hypothetical protein
VVVGLHDVDVEFSVRRRDEDSLVDAKLAVSAESSPLDPRSLNREIRPPSPPPVRTIPGGYTLFSSIESALRCLSPWNRPTFLPAPEGP